MQTKKDKCRAETDAEQKRLCLPSYSASKQTSLILKEVANEVSQNVFCPLVYGAQAVSKTAASEANGLGSIPRWASI